MHLPFLLPVVICTLIKYEPSPFTSNLLPINDTFLGSSFISNNTNSHFQLQQVWHHPRSRVVFKGFNGKISFIVWITCSWMHSMMDSCFLGVSFKVSRFSSFAVTFWIVSLNYFVVSIHQNLFTKNGSVVFSSIINPGVIHPFTHTHTRVVFMPHCTAFFVDCFFILRTNHTLISSVLPCCCAVLYSLLIARLFLRPHFISHTEHTLSIVSHPSCSAVSSAWACTWQRTQSIITLKINVWHQGLTDPVTEGYYISQTVDKIGRWSSRLVSSVMCV